MTRDVHRHSLSAHTPPREKDHTLVPPNPSAASTPATPIYVWASEVQLGEYALCTDPPHRDFQNADWWRFRGELATVPELDGFPRPTIADGWPMRVRRGD